MPAMRHDFIFPERFVVGAIGEVDDRTYVLQVRQERRLMTMSCDPMQIEALANHMERVLDEVNQLSHGTLDVPEPVEAPSDLDPLDVPIERDFAIGTLAIGWNVLAQSLHIELFSEAGEEPTTPADAADPDADLSGEQMALREADRADEMCTIRLRPPQGREFVARARAVLAADLPSCPLCAQPIRAGGHVCPRRNGYLGRSGWQAGGGPAG